MSDHPEKSIRYTHGHDAGALASHGARTASNSAGYLIDRLQPGMSVLDVGCGPGSITLDLAELVAPGQVIGLDRTDAPLGTARAAAEQRGDQRTIFQVGDVAALPFDDATFDVCHAHQVLQHLGDPVAALREMMRVTKPGGWVAARDADYAAMAWYPQVPELELWRTTYRSMARANGAEPDAGRRMRAWAREAGLDQASISTSVWQYATPETTRWWGEGQATRCVTDSFIEQAAAFGVDAAQAQQIAAGWRRWGADPDAWFVIVNVELLAQLAS